MLTSKYTSYDQLPLVLNARDMADLLGISMTAAYGLIHAENFPTITVGRRKLVPRDELIKWMNGQRNSVN